MNFINLTPFDRLSRVLNLLRSTGIARALLLVGFFAQPCLAATSTELIAQLQSANIAVRRRAIDRIQTLGDRRIAEACLPLLRDEGDSIRRQAARAIGSRYREIPRGRLGVFLAELRACGAAGPEDVTLLTDRAVGLLTRKAKGAAFSRSPDGRWVLFEQRRLPVVADHRFQRPQLLAPTHPDEEMVASDDTIERGEVVDVERKTRLLKLQVTNESVESLFDPHWEPKGAALALEPRIQRRFYSPIVLWRARDGAVRSWSVRSFRKLYGRRFPHWGTVLDFVKWRGHRAIFKIYDADSAGPGEPFDPSGIMVSVDVDTWRIDLE